MDGTADPGSGLEDAYVRVFERDPALLSGLDATAAEGLREYGTVPRVDLEPGAWHPPLHRASTRGWLGLLVLDGMLARPVTIGDLRVHELLGPGDLLRPWDHPTWEGIVRSQKRWSVLGATTIAVLDQRFGGVAARTSGLMVELLSRTQQRTSQLAAGVAITQAGEPAARVEMLVRYLGERYGPRAPALTETAIAVAVQAEGAAVRAALDQLVADGRARREGHRVAPMP